MYLFIFFFFLHIIRTEILLESITVVNQLGVSDTDTTAKLPSQKFTDIQPHAPRLFSVDDFFLPQNISTNISVMQFLFTSVRLMNDAEPDSITLVLMYDNNANQGQPGEVFFSKNVRAPNNPPRWGTVGTHEVISLNLTHGEECSEHANHLFDLHNTTFLPRLTRLWVGFYVTGARHYNISRPLAQRENIVFWCMTNQSRNSNSSFLHDATYYFIDEANILGKGLSNWSNASLVERVLSIRSTPRNMAWSLTLLGVAPSTYLEMLQKASAKQIITVVSCALVAIAFCCCCTWCVCKRCKRCRFRRQSLGKDAAYKKVDLIPVYNVSDTSSKTQQQLHSVSEGESFISLSETQGSNSGSSIIPIIRNTPSGKFLNDLTNNQIRGGSGDNSKQD